MRRGAPVFALGLVVALVLGSYIVYTQRVVRELRADAARNGRMYARVFRALGDTSQDAGNAALLDLSSHIREVGVPVIVTDAEGRPTAAANLPFEAPLSDPRVRAYLSELDRHNPPVVEEEVGMVHYGDSRVVASLRVIPALEAVLLALVLGASFLVLRTHNRADQERVWAGMARESAHQLATPLSSLSGWMALLQEGSEEPIVATAVVHMQGDLDRLERVAHRFERIGRPARQDDVDVRVLAEGVVRYFAARVPTLAHRVAVQGEFGDGPLVVRGDPVLLEWALEALVKNAVDALAGRGGQVLVSAHRLDHSRVRLRVADDGPGVARELRARIFDAGFSTKEAGWGIGLSLARRIVEEAHRGTLTLVPADRGATFDVILPG
ncbi:MAG: HAMP domain-containing histidine kinase [Gemmatimonadota bacterium]|nr:HAMP domain-containing histidine kinase [Gemmatimonadota bacterium]